MVITIPKLEMHLADACNLRCTGCTHFADQGLAGVLAPVIGARWLRCWAERVSPVRFSLLGGEPLLNPDVAQFVRLARATWPRTELRLVTNGLLLPRHEELWSALADTRSILTISLHSRAEEYVRRLTPALSLARRRCAELGLRLDERDAVNGWYKLYQGAGPAMQPFTDGDPAASWSVCQTKHCLTLRDNALWKCPPLAHLPLAARRHGLDRQPGWRPYLEYRPLPVTASDDEIRRFVARRAEPACGMCPARLRYFEKSVSGEPAPW
jgi:hypothetical protein